MDAQTLRGKSADWENCAKKSLSFGDKGVMAVYLYADVALRPQAEKTLEKFKQVCGLQFPELHEVENEVLEGAIDWASIYNDEVRRIVEEEFGFRTFVDRWGAYCWEDERGEITCGDQYGFYPFYTDEKLLRRRLQEGKVGVV